MLLTQKKIPPQQKVRRYRQIRLTEMDEGRNYSDKFGNKVYQLQPVVVQQAAEEVSRREVVATLEEGSEDDLLLDVLAWELLPSGSSSLHLYLQLEQAPPFHC
jgi:hypothetical protein